MRNVPQIILNSVRPRVVDQRLGFCFEHEISVVASGRSYIRILEAIEPSKRKEYKGLGQFCTDGTKRKDDLKHLASNCSDSSSVKLKHKNVEPVFATPPPDQIRKPVKLKNVTLLNNSQYRADYIASFKHYNVGTGHKIMKNRNKVSDEFPSVCETLHNQ